MYVALAELTSLNAPFAARVFTDVRVIWVLAIDVIGVGSSSSLKGDQNPSVSGPRKADFV